MMLILIIRKMLIPIIYICMQYIHMDLFLKKYVFMCSFDLSPPTTTTHICFSVISIAHSSLMFSPHKYTSPITPLFARYPATSMLFRAISRSTRRCNFRPRRLFGALELGHGASEAEVLLKKSLASNGDLAIENCNLTLENWDLAIENWDLG